MKDRKAFTLIELLVVIGIIALLAGILLPAVNHMRRSAQITGQKADFQSIATALEQYKSDFGDYPRNGNLPKWNTSPLPPLVSPSPAPIFYSLAAALMGPGPAMTELIPPASTNLEMGDGSDGPGFRCEISGAIPGSTCNISSGSTALTVNVTDPAYFSQAQALVANFVAPGGSNGSGTPTLVTLDPGQPNQETLGIGLVSGPPSSLSVTTLSPAVYTHSLRCLISAPSGKVWGPYISADTFKVAYIPKADVNGVLLGGVGALNPIGGWGNSVLLDRWGQVIQYFPTYGSVNNRANDSVLYPTPTKATLAAISAGPLYGYSQPVSIDAKNGQNTIWDARDGAPFYIAGSGSSPAFCQIWQDVISPSGNTSYYFRPGWALQWMLGDQPDPTTNLSDNLITGAEKLSYSGPYILISAGPDGPSRANGGYCNMIDPTAGTPLPANTWQQTFIKSGNIYNFDRQ
jgi:prepilin-type N-terminal cleavage/methylation domain-containing protein